MILVGISGLPGSGKTIAMEVAKEFNFHVVSMGDVIRELAKQMSRSPSIVATSTRLSFGSRFIAYKTLELLKDLKVDKLCIEGIRSIREVETFEEHFKTQMKLIFIVAPWRIRFERLLKRGRPDDPKTIEEFLERDYRELRFGLANLIARADYIIVNTYQNVEDFKDELRKIFNEIISYK